MIWALASSRPLYKVVDRKSEGVSATLKKYLIRVMTNNISRNDRVASSSKTGSTTGRRLLVIEDDPGIARMIADYFRHLGDEVLTASDGETGRRMAIDEKPTAVILDLMLPRLDGLSVCRAIRELTPSIPILILTAKEDVIDKVLGLEMGADDYMTKPFSLRELEARIKTVLRRAHSTPVENESPEPKPIIRGKLRIDPIRREVALDDRLIELTRKEFELLLLLASHPGRAYSRKYLLENIWDYNFSGYDRTIDSHINRLRAKIEENADEPKMVLTVWGVGYKFNDA
jgi:two-component system alkaline phosphatase synthesis response regulator PhoP